ncbi:EAL domain-containing protein [Metaplanococcus flavidus]|uniref:EAL-associated domain-containing protein n=1 Tax=Metaplanococcus flavidus TaxID=569883 RepID=A0ABW3LFX8_9BACL
MDPLLVLENPENIKPVFQPIVSAVKHTIIGYEVRGRFNYQDEWQSLGEFFQNPDVPDDFKIEIDTHLLRMAMQKMMKHENKCKLFLYRDAKQLLADGGGEFIAVLQEFEAKGFSLDRIVLEITEHAFEEDFESLNHLLLYYKTFGIQIAVDHIGAKSSNIDRIRQLKPDILKIDTTVIRTNRPEIFQDIIYSLSLLARRIGAKLLYEHIEDEHQLHFAWKHGGHYYQGYYLAKPDFSLLSNGSLKVDVNDSIQKFIDSEKSLILKCLAYSSSCDEILKKVVPKWHGIVLTDNFFTLLTKPFDKDSFRMYICNANGRQISSNCQKRNGLWQIESEHMDSNWAFRPYFLENIMRMKKWPRGILSDTYSDIETGEIIRTFSYPLSEDSFLFIDISSDFLYENDYLLRQ